MSSSTKVIDGKMAISELISELDRTRRDLGKSTLALSQAEASVLQMKETIAAKDRLVSQLQNELVERDSSHRLEVAAVAQGSEAQHSAAGQHVLFLENELARKKQELDVAGDYVAQNQQLRDVLAQCHKTLAELQQANAELRAKMANEVKSRTESLETEFSQRLMESERKLRQDAFNALSEEAKVALAGNDKLQTVLQRQNETLDSVLERCRHLEAAQTKIEEERKIVESDASTQGKEIQRLHRVLDDAGDRSTQLEDALKQRRIERASFELLFVEHNAVKEELAKEKDLGRRAVREATRWREKAFELTEQLGSDDAKQSAVQKLQAISSHSELLEKNAERNRRRREKLQAAKKQNAAVAEAVVKFENNVDDMPSDDDDDDRDHAGSGGSPLLPAREQKLQVNAMDILAIWNVNYETEEAGFYRGGGGTSPTPQQQQFSESSSTPNNNNTNNSGKRTSAHHHHLKQQQHQHHNQKSIQLPAIPAPQQHHHVLKTDADRSKRDASLSVVAAQKLPGTHNVRRLKESAQQAHATRANAQKDAFALSGIKQQVPM